MLNQLSSSLLVDLVLSCILGYLPVQCLLWYALVVHTEDMSKPVKSSFSQYVVHGRQSGIIQPIKISVDSCLTEIGIACGHSEMVLVSCKV